MTAAPGSEDAGLVLSAEERRLTEEERDRLAGAPPWRRWAVLDAIKADAYAAGYAAARIARTPARAAGDDEGGDGRG